MIEQCQCCGSEIRRYKGTFISGPNYILSHDKKTITKSNDDGWNANAIGSEIIPLGTITIINFKIEKTAESHIMFGIAPKTMDQKLVTAYAKCGWYYYSYSGGLYCEPPLSYNNFKFIDDSKLPEGTIITLIVDTTIGKISYKINDSQIKTAYHVTFPEGVVPCVVLYNKGDSARTIQNQKRVSNTNFN